MARPLYLPERKVPPLKPRDLYRFMHHVRIEGDCWFWDNVSEEGYGRFRIGPFSYGAHRVAYAHFVGAIPDDYEVDHLCRNPSCVNPDHLEAVTQEENNRRSNSPTAINARMVHCKNGHPFDEKNAYIRYYKGKPRRICRVCEAEKTRRRRARLKAEATSHDGSRMARLQRPAKDAGSSPVG
jgi:hypothetical protein